MAPSSFNNFRWPLGKYLKFSGSGNNILTLLSTNPGDLTLELHLSARRLIVKHHKAVIEEISLQPLHNIKPVNIRHKQIDIVFDEIHTKGTKFRVKFGESGGMSAETNIQDCLSQIRHFVPVIEIASTTDETQNSISYTQNTAPQNLSLEDSQFTTTQQFENHASQTEIPAPQNESQRELQFESQNNNQMVPQTSSSKKFTVPLKKSVMKTNCTQETHTKISLMDVSTQTMTSSFAIPDDLMLERLVLETMQDITFPNFTNKINEILNKNNNK